MVAVAVRIVRRVGLFRSAVRQLVGRVREYRVPPVEEFGRVARARDGVFASPGAGRHFYCQLVLSFTRQIEQRNEEQQA